jgi:hypothetical protein
MPKPLFNGVVEAVHYDPDGKVAWVRVYERRGPTFSDRLIINRQTFIERIKAGRKYLAGRRVPLMASTFETSDAIHYIQDGDAGVLVTGERQAKRDNLEGVPVI